jgi:hypothetical protein
MSNFNEGNQSQRQINQSSNLLNHMAGYQLFPKRSLTQTTMMRTLRQLRPAKQSALVQWSNQRAVKSLVKNCQADVEN